MYASKPSLVEKKHKRSKAVQAVLDVLTLVLVAGATYAIFRLTIVKPENRESNNPEVVSKVQVDDEKEGEQFWLTRTLSSWVGTFSRDFVASVEVYDLDKDAVVGELSPETVFAGHYESEMGARVGRNLTGSGQVNVQELIEVAKAVFRHEGMSAEEWTKYRETLLAQTEVFSEERCHGYCQVRAGLPAGFTSEAVKVYNENFMDTNGSFFEVYRDVAIVEFKVSESQTRSFAVALLARSFPSQASFQKLGEMLEKVMLAHIENEALVSGEELRPVGFVLGIWVKDEANGKFGEVRTKDVGAVVGGVHPGGDDGFW